MKINAGKCKAISFTRVKDPPIFGCVFVCAKNSGSEQLQML